MMDLSQALARYPGAQTFTSGDSEALNREVLELMRSGHKTMTCEAWEVFKPGGEAMPMPGRIDVALDWNGQPAVAVRTLKVERLRFYDVTEAYVAPQAEFRDLAHWRAAYKEYYTRVGLFHDDLELMVETFELVEDFRQTVAPAERGCSTTDADTDV